MQDLQIELPIGINPVTAFPTYIISESSNTIRGFASNGGIFDIRGIFGKLDHEFIDSLDFNLRKIIPNVTMETPLAYPAGKRKGQDIRHICFIDTPGYNTTGVSTRIPGKDRLTDSRTTRIPTRISSKD